MTPGIAYSRLMNISGALSTLAVLSMLPERALALNFKYMGRIPI